MQKNTLLLIVALCIVTGALFVVAYRSCANYKNEACGQTPIISPIASPSASLVPTFVSVPPTLQVTSMSLANTPTPGPTATPQPNQTQISNAASADNSGAAPREAPQTGRAVK